MDPWNYSLLNGVLHFWAPAFISYFASQIVKGYINLTGDVPRFAWSTGFLIRLSIDVLLSLALKVLLLDRSS